MDASLGIPELKLTIYREYFRKYGEGFTIKGYYDAHTNGVPSEYKEALYAALSYIEDNLPLSVVLVIPTHLLLEWVRMVTIMYYHRVDSQSMSHDDFVVHVLRASGLERYFHVV